MATFVIETYLSRARADELPVLVDRLRVAIATAAPPGTSYLRSFYVADDEIAYLMLDAASVGTVDRVAVAAGLDATRVVEASAPP